MSGTSTIASIRDFGIGGGLLAVGIDNGIGGGVLQGVLPNTGNNAVFSLLTILALSLGLAVILTRLVKIYKLTKNN